MHKDRIDEDRLGEDASHPDREDARTQAAVLACVLSEHPTQFTDAELAREMVSDRLGFHGRDDHDRAVKTLVCAGLLQWHGEFILPTRAALAYYRLELE